MTELASATILSVFVIFCRIGACLMLMPGFSSPRVPPHVRLFLALAVTLALTPILLPTAEAVVTDASPATLLPLIVSELLVGALIGLLARFFFLALQTLANAMVMAIGFANLPGAPIEEADPSAAMVSLITLSAAVLVFLTEQHWEIFRALLASYGALPPTEGFRVQFGLMQMADSLSEAFFLALRVASPFIIYSVVVNLAIGLMNKLTPQIPVYFISLPFIVAGGLFLLYFTIQEFLRLFMAGFAAWLVAG